jgi:hypothetical protein
VAPAINMASVSEWKKCVTLAALIGAATALVKLWP